MVALPLRRLVPYIAGSIVVLAVGAWTLHGSVSASGSDGESAVIISPGTTLSADGQSVGGAGSEGPSAGDAQGGPSTTTAAATVFVQIAGAVRRPGVYEVPAGSRVFEALLEAGGVAPEGDEQALPLAAPVTDGMRVFVPRKDQVASGGGGGGGATGGGLTVPVAGTSSGPISLNTATAAQLDQLPGIGPATAARIIAYREANGPFSTVDELDDVSGIGPATVERLRDLVQP